MFDGRHGHNAWLHELPDPVTKVTWDNYACLSPGDATRLGIEDGDVVRIAAADPVVAPNGAGGASPLELPAFVQPGQPDATVAIALGYGRAGTDRFARVGPPWVEARASAGVVGVNAAALVGAVDGARQYAGRAVTVVKTGRRQQLASTQTHHSLAVAQDSSPALGNVSPVAQDFSPAPGRMRPIVQEVTLAALAGSTAEPAPHRSEGDLWPPDHQYPGRRWGMAVDLDSCTGCSACVIACQSENNVPVVGQDEVRRQREMHWIRIDRYYSGTADNPEVAHQPMMCQHCEQAPCETVCPVLATTHSEEGLNEQVYNRCVGTRYCANNCPYKVRRFNWFDYPHEDRLQNLVFNPNVTVRSRGVMEKCTFCVQRIEETKIEARRLGQPLADGAIKTACEQVCPAQAIVFGDLNDPKSRVAALADSRRAYRVLEELNTKPAVRYLKLVRRSRQTCKELPQTRTRSRPCRAFVAFVIPCATIRSTRWISSRRQRHVPLIAGRKSAADVTRDVCGALDAKPSGLWWIGLALSSSALLLGVVAVSYQIATGIGTWGLNTTVGWAFDITNFVFWIGIGHAGTLISAILFLLRQRWRTSVNRAAEAMTLFAVMCAGLFPLIHMGRPWLVFWVFPYPNTRGPLWINFRSPLVWDFFAISTYFTISAIFWYIGLLPDLATIRDRDRDTTVGRLAGLARRIFELVEPRLERRRTRPGTATRSSICCWRRSPRRSCCRCTASSAWISPPRWCPAGTRRFSRRTSWPARSSPAWRWC